MMRTVEVLLVIIIIAGAFLMTSTFTVLPWPREVSPVNLRRLALTTLQTLDATHDLSVASFDTGNSTVWNRFQIALSASLPPNVIYNLTVYDVGNGESGDSLYSSLKSISNSEDLGITSDASSYLVASSNATFHVTPEKIGEGSGGTLYILNCSDANGWWITGYSAQGLAEDLCKLLSPFFVSTVLVQNTSQFSQILGNTSLQGEVLQNAVVINPFGETVPIPGSYCQPPYSEGSYANFFHNLGQKVRLYNWTWASIVGYPFYYVSNTQAFAAGNNGWGIYGMTQTGRAGVNAFLQGLDNQSYQYNDASLIPQYGSDVQLSQKVLEYCNYYGIYPSPTQTSTRALRETILSAYHLRVGLSIFDNFTQSSSVYNPGAVYQHVPNGTTISGSLLALGLARIPDVRLTALGLLSYYQPRLYRSEYSATDTARLVILQLGLLGGT